MGQMRTVAERTAAEMERIEESLISVAEVLAYLETDRYLSLKEAAEYLPLSERTIREHLKVIPHFRYGKKIIFRRSELDGWIESFRVRDQDLDVAMRKAEEMLA